MCVYLDDILVTGTSENDHLVNLEEVLKRLQDAGMRLKKEKCAFMLSEVGHKITKKGLQPTKEKIRAIKKASVPTNISQLKSFLGMIK